MSCIMPGLSVLRLLCVIKSSITRAYSKAIFSSSLIRNIREPEALAIFTPVFRLFSNTMSCGKGTSCGDLSKKLTPQQYRVTQEKGTERAFTGEFYDHHEKGTYTCVCCETPLFGSDTKYDSGSGWPSFFKTIEDPKTGESVERKSDGTFGMVRVEVVCKKCSAHLGHVFDDGPQPTGERFCINSASLGFIPEKK